MQIVMPMVKITAWPMFSQDERGPGADRGVLVARHGAVEALAPPCFSLPKYLTVSKLRSESIALELRVGVGLVHRRGGCLIRQSDAFTVNQT